MKHLQMAAAATALAVCLAAADGSRTRLSFTTTPLSFEPNVGQSDAAAKFIARGAGYSVQLQSSSARIGVGASQAVTMDLVNGRRDASMSGEDLLLGKANYFPTSDRKSWHANIPTYSKVRSSSVYPGVDAVYHGNAARFEYDFLLQPGADAGQIRMKLGGADKVNIADSGDLVLRFGGGELRFFRPVAYQTAKDGTRQEVAASYRLDGAGLVSFALGRYDRSRALVIDPQVGVDSPQTSNPTGMALIYSEYLLGTNGYEITHAVAIDNSGDAYVASEDPTSGFYLTEFNASGAVVFTTTVGNGPLSPSAVAVDESGGIHVVGLSLAGSVLPTSTNSYMSKVTAPQNAFYAQIASGGSSVPYATFLGGKDSGTSGANGLDVDQSGNAYICGYTDSPSFPVTPGAYQGTYLPSGSAFVARINPAASGSTSLVYATFLNFEGAATAIALAVDSGNNAYVTGGSRAAPPSMFVAALNPGGTKLLYLTNYGDGTGAGIAVDRSGYAYVLEFNEYGFTIVVKYAPDGTRVWATPLLPYFPVPDPPHEPSLFRTAIAIPKGCASSCNAYVFGLSSAVTLIDAFQNQRGSPYLCGFLLELAADGQSMVLASYLSALTESYDYGPASLAVDSSGNVSVTGSAMGADFPISIPSATPGEVFLAKIGPSSEPSIVGVPYSVSFGSQSLGLSTSNTISLRNLSTLPATLQPIQASPGVFSEADNCHGAIAAGDFCTLTVNFTPVKTGPVSGAVSVTSNALNSPAVIALSGAGLDAPNAAVSPATLTFGVQALGTTSPAQTATLSNVGTLPLTLQGIGANGDFAQTNNCGTTLKAGSTCTISVTFTPTASGLRSGSVGIVDNGSSIANSDQTIGLAGTGAGPAASLTPTALALGSQNVGTASSSQTATLSNSGIVPLTITSVSIGGINPGDFAETTTCGSSLAAGQNCGISVTFTPTADGSRGATLIVTDNANGAPGSIQNVALSGTGLWPLAQLPVYSNIPLPFGAQSVATTSPKRTVGLENWGELPLSIASVAIGGADPGDFSLTNNCPAVLASGKSCSVTVTFTPTSVGSRSAILTFTDNSRLVAGSTQTVSLTGTGAQPVASLSFTSLLFGSQNLTTTSAAQTVRLTNTGNGPLSVSGIGISGTNATEFAQTKCPTSLAAGAGCTISVTFTPTTVGSASATLVITDNSLNVAGSTQQVSLTGTGVQVPVVSISPSHFVFANLNVGSTSAAETFTIGNTGQAGLAITSIAISGSSAAEFPQTDNCPGTLAMNSTCTVSVTFAPTTIGTGSGALILTDNNNGVTGSTQHADLSGTGIGPNAALAPYSLSFGSQNVGSSSAAQTATLKNSGNATLTITAIGFTGTNPTDYAETDTCAAGTFPATLAAGATCAINVTFTPATAGYRVATLVVTDNRLNVAGKTQSVSLSGTGLAPEASPTPASLTFSALSVGKKSAAQTVTLSNRGNATLNIASIALGGTNAGDFSQTTTCAATLAGKTSCTISVKFAPTATGARSADLLITDNANNASAAVQDVPLSGTGQ